MLHPDLCDFSELTLFLKEQLLFMQKEVQIEI